MKRHIVIILCMIIPASTGFSSFSAKPKSSSRPSVENSNQDISKQILALARSGKTSQAIELYYSAFEEGANKKRGQINTRMMNNAIAACARPFKPLYNEAFDIYHFGLERGLRPNVYTFGSLMSVCAKRGDVAKCLSLIKQMKESGIKPNSVIYSTAISACERCSPPRSDLALDLLKDSIKEGTLEGFMNIVGFNAAISVCARAGEWQLACQILNEMEGHGISIDKKPILDSNTFIPKPDEVTYGTVMAACERAKEWHRVLELSNRMQSHRSDLEMDGMSISSALHACQQLGYGRDALNYLNQMKQLSRLKNVKRERGNQRRKALNGPDDVAYRLAISACARGGLIQEALDLVGMMEKETGVRPDVAAYTAAIGGCVESGDYIQAFGILKEMKNNGVQPNVITYSAVISSCATASAMAEKSQKEKKQRVTHQSDEESMKDIQKPMRAAMMLLESMKNSKDPELQPNIVTYNASIRACAEGLDDTKAFILLEELQKRGLKPTIVTFGSLMTACERVGNVEGVGKVFQLMRDEGIEPNEIVFGAAISCHRKSKEPHRTLELLRKMIESKLYPNTATFNTVLMAQIESKNMEKASAVFRLLTSNHSKRAHPNRQTYNILIKAMADNLQPAEAENYLHRMKEEGFKPDVDLLTAIVSSYERAKEPIKALKMMEAIREEGYDFYQMKIFDAAFKQGVKVINNVVEKGFGGKNSARNKITD